MKYLAMEQPSRVEASTPAALSLPTDAGRQRRRRSWTAEQKLAIRRPPKQRNRAIAPIRAMWSSFSVTECRPWLRRLTSQVAFGHRAILLIFVSYLGARLSDKSTGATP